MDSKPTRVLLIEGDADDEALIASYLKEVDLTRAPRLSTACHLLSKESFDAIVLDISLPQTSEVDGFLKLRALRPELPVLILTGARDEVLAVRAMELGAQDYFVKGAPDCHLLRRAVRYAVERKALLNELETLRKAQPSAPAAGAGALEARNHFLGRISHELRNTLATMKTAAYCLKDDSGEKLSARQTQLVDMISRNIDRQTRIVENILDLSRLRSGKLKIRFRQADAAAIIAELADEYKLSRGGQRLHLDVEGGLPHIDCDPDLIAQVLRNLLDNAARYAKERIAIAASRSGSGIAVSVTDDGTGIPEDRLGALFTPFNRLDDVENGGGSKGSGLGLAICREIIEGHHGRIRAENATGAGARFTFELPARSPAANGVKPSAPGKQSYPLHK